MVNGRNNCVVFRWLRVAVAFLYGDAAQPRAVAVQTDGVFSYIKSNPAICTFSRNIIGEPSIKGSVIHYRSKTWRSTPTSTAAATTAPASRRWWGSLINCDLTADHAYRNSLPIHIPNDYYGQDESTSPTPCCGG